MFPFKMITPLKKHQSVKLQSKLEQVPTLFLFQLSGNRYLKGCQLLGIATVLAFQWEYVFAEKKLFGSSFHCVRFDAIVPNFTIVESIKHFSDVGIPV